MPPILRAVTTISDGAGTAFDLAGVEELRFNAALAATRVTDDGPIRIEVGNTGAVATVAVTAPVENTGTATAPIIGIVASTAVVPGSMSAPHFALVNNATASPTADRLTLRGATGELLGAWLTDAAGLAAGTAAGLVRAAKNVVVAAARDAAGVADHTLLATDAADGVILGDLVYSAAITAKMKAAGLLQILANTTKIMSASAAGVAFYGDVDAGGGTGVVTLHNSAVVPTTTPADGAIIHNVHGAVAVTSPIGIRTGVNAAGDGLGATQIEFEPRVGNLQTTDATTTLILAITIPATYMPIEVELSVIGYHVDTAFYARRILRARRIAAGVVNVEVLTPTGITDTNDFGAGTAVSAAAGSVNVNDLEISVAGPTVAATVDWIAHARVTYYQP